MSKRAGAGDDEVSRKRRATGGAGDGSAPFSREDFLEVFKTLTNELVTEVLPGYEMGKEPQAWMRRMTDYNVPGGKLNRGLTVVHALQTIKGAETTPEDIRRACILGWCIEWLQACFLVADDIMDASPTRRGAPCWYKVDDVKLIAINDAFLLRSSLLVFVKREFRGDPFYADLLDLINETTFQTELGQLLDLTSAPLGGQVDLSRFTEERHRLIVKYKTSFYSFYMPVAMAMMLGGVTDAAEYDAAKDILTDMGVYFQVQDDYLDCYADPETLGKIGTDIEDNKCGWLAVQALKLANDAQRKLLHDHYGRDSKDSVALVKDLYKTLELEKLFLAYEEDAYASLRKRIDGLSGKTPGAVFDALLSKIYKRKK